MKNRTGFLFSLLLLFTPTLVAQQPQQPNPATPTAAPATAQIPAGDAKKPAMPDKPEPPKDKPFADIVKDAQVVKGLFRLYRTDE